MIGAEHLAAWTPIRIYRSADQVMVDWCYVGAAAFDEPFFDQTIQSALYRPFNQLFRPQTTFEELGRLVEERPGLPPSGFIFHMSRCGSTLISRLLGTLPGTLVLSEPGSLTRLALLSSEELGVSDATHCQWLRDLVAALGQARRFSGGTRSRVPGVGGTRDSRLVIKFDAWSVCALPLLRRAFPAVPWIFVHRDPLEVLAAQERLRGSQMLPGAVDPRLIGLEWAQLNGLTLDRFCAIALAAFCDAAGSALPSGGRLVDYRQLPELVWGDLAAWFGMSITEDDRDRMQQAARFNAKSPTEMFVPDSDFKRMLAPDELRELADQIVAPAYRRLVDRPPH